MSEIQITPVPEGGIGVNVPIWLSAFLLPLVLTPLDNGVDWRVTETFGFESITLRKLIIVEAGEITNLASIPRICWTVVGGPTGKYTKPAALHDHCYHTPGLCTRLQADHVLLEAMDVMGVPWLTKREVFDAVRLFGGPSYKGGL